MRPFPVSCTITLKDLTRFWARIKRSESCWLWTGSKSTAPGQMHPYGHFYFAKGMYLAHRVAYFFEYKQDPGDLLVMHQCNNTLCVRPDHLKLGTATDNNSYTTQCGHRAVGELVGGSRLRESDISSIFERYNNGESRASIARSLAVSYNAINCVIQGETWKHVPRG